MKEQIEEMVEFLNNRINVERNSYFGKGCITIPLIEADKILDIIKGYRKQSEAEWISNELGGYKYAFYCSECGWVDGYPFNDRHKYCPNCGAKMKGGAE